MGLPLRRKLASLVGWGAGGKRTLFHARELRTRFGANGCLARGLILACTYPYSASMQAGILKLMTGANKRPHLGPSSAAAPQYSR